jgi:signal transduction histidine kinase
MNAALEEQARSIGQALHDETGQILTLAFNALAVAASRVPVPAREDLDAVKSHLEVLEEQLRRLAYELRPRILDDLGLVAALRFLTEGMTRRRGIAVGFAASLGGSVPVPVETAVFRLVQESLTNISRHSGATRVLVELEEQPGVLRCRISDNGVGFDAARPPGAGLGLVGIRDRLNALGATLTIRSTVDAGTELLAILPLEERNACPNSHRRRPSDRARGVPRDSRARRIRDRC